MAKISNAKPKNRSQGYGILLGNETMAKALSQAQSTVITLGHELEKFAFQSIEQKSGIDEFIIAQDASKIVYFGKDAFKSYKKEEHPLIDYRSGNSKSVPDGLLFISGTAYVCEIKLGFSFDNKKSIGEFQSLKVKHAQTESVLKEYGFTVKQAFTVFMPAGQERAKEIIYEGCKNKIPQEWLYSLEELYQMAGLDYDTLVGAMQQDQQENQDYLRSQFT